MRNGSTDACTTNTATNAPASHRVRRSLSREIGVAISMHASGATSANSIRPATSHENGGTNESG